MLFTLNPRSREGATRSGYQPPKPLHRFNPRSREGATMGALTLAWVRV
ncbi:MAG: hypothetical protein HC845_06770 [Akkermansiaceae bacterium]|nr:hypothetical protein [Akkermansiaceae bacterium]